MRLLIGDIILIGDFSFDLLRPDEGLSFNLSLRDGDLSLDLSLLIGDSSFNLSFRNDDDCTFLFGLMSLPNWSFICVCVSSSEESLAFRRFDNDSISSPFLSLCLLLLRCLSSGEDDGTKSFDEPSITCIKKTNVKTIHMVLGSWTISVVRYNPIHHPRVTLLHMYAYVHYNHRYSNLVGGYLSFIL